MCPTARGSLPLLLPNSPISVCLSYSGCYERNQMVQPNRQLWNEANGLFAFIFY